MSRPAGNSWRLAIASLALAPLLSLTACASSKEAEMAEKLAAAEAAAAKAIAAQEAAEKAAAIAASSRPAPAPMPTQEQSMIDDSPDSVDYDNPPHGGLVPIGNDVSFDSSTLSDQG